MNEDTEPKLVPSTDTILWGGVVDLKVTDPPTDWQTQRYRIRWYAGSSVIEDDYLKTAPEDPLSAQWDTSSVAKGLLTQSPHSVIVNVRVEFSKLDDSAAPPEGAECPITLWPLPEFTVSVTDPTPSPAPAAPSVVEGHTVELKAGFNNWPPSGIVVQIPAALSTPEEALKTSRIKLRWKVDGRSRLDEKPEKLTASWNTTRVPLGTHQVRAELVNDLFVDRPLFWVPVDIVVLRRPLAEKDTLPVALQRTFTQPTGDQALWVAIRNRTKAIAFSGSGYKDFIDAVLCKTPPSRPVGSLTLDRQRGEYGQVRRDPANTATTIVAGVGAYELLKTATEVFLLLNCGVAIRDDDEPFDPTAEATRTGEVLQLGEIQDRLEDYLGTAKQLPYIKRIIANVFPGLNPSDRIHCDGILVRSRVQEPCLLELIWSYWHEEGMLVQSINAISRRFQNLRSRSGQDPLAHLEIDPIQPLNNVLWGYIQDEQHRLSVQRRAYEYDHHYGITLYGKAVTPLQSVDSRSKFLEAYHNLLYLCTAFYSEDDDTTRIADAFPLLNALKETHLLLAQGAHNQFGDLPWTARAEMLMQEWLLARPEIRDFLQSRPMVPYQEGWMAQVDTVKKLQGWTDVSVMHFHDLGVYGEQILLSVRYGDWIDVNDPAQAANWARYWRPEIQSYIHDYRAVTGVDLTTAVTSEQALSLRTTPPSVLLRQRLEGGGVPMLPAPASVATPQGFRARRSTPRK